MERWDFDGWAESYDEDVETDDWIHRDYWRVLKLVAERAKGLVLDVGCGTGNILRFLDPGNYIGEKGDLAEEIEDEYFATVEGLRDMCRTRTGMPVREAQPLRLDRRDGQLTLTLTSVQLFQPTSERATT